MRSKRRGRARWGVPFLVFLLMASCVASPSSPTPFASPTPLSPRPTPTATPGSGPWMVTLTLWIPEELSPYSDQAGADLLASRLADFGAAYPDLQVQTIVKKSHGRGGLLDFLRTASVAAPSVLPDLVVLDEADLQVAARSGLLQPLDGLIPPDLETDLFPFATGLGRVGESTFGLPLATEVQHLAYAPALFSTPPISWSAVLSAGFPLFFPAAGQNGIADDFMFIQYLGAGGHLVNDEGNPTLEEGPLTAVLDFYAQATATRVISPLVVLSLGNLEECWALFQQEGGMTVVDSRWFWTKGADAAEPGPIPTRDGRPVALAEGWVLALVTANPEQQQRAMTLAAWLLEPDWYGEWTQRTGYLPVTQSGLAEWVVSAERREMLRGILAGAREPLPSSLRARLGPPLQIALEAVLRGRQSPAEAATRAIQSLE
ncbi:MAG: extracellular solute-binding protein [Anaerolineae bacterium]|nr:extracellular solute-binding protein [Anaerolineae bacterium]MDW8067899.1 extracellular solute-binding protein [Anaerolineae bacterium]